MLVYIWRIWCTVEGAYFEVVSATPPTVHGAHAIDANKSAIVGLLNSDKPGGSGGGPRVQAIFQDDANKPHAEIVGTSWVTVGDFRFPGTDAWTPTAMTAVMEKDTSSTKKHAVRLYDVTHALAICDSGLMLLAETPAVYSVTAFTNLPAGESVFEVQVKAENSSYGGKIYWVDLEG